MNQPQPRHPCQPPPSPSPHARHHPLGLFLRKTPTGPGESKVKKKKKTWMGVCHSEEFEGSLRKVEGNEGIKGKTKF